MRRVRVGVRVTCPECSQLLEARTGVDVPKSALMARIEVYKGALPAVDNAATALQKHLRSRHGWESEALAPREQKAGPPPLK